MRTKGSFTVRLGPSLAALLLLSTPLVAHADPKDDARRHFAAGLKAAQEGDFEIALQRFLAAQEAYPHPATLYNIAKAYQDLDDDLNALTYYRLYRAAQPDSAKTVDPVIAAMEARSGAPELTPTTPQIGESVAGTGGATQLVLSGPTPEELSRLEQIANDLDSLTVAMRAKSQGGQPPSEAELARQQGLATEIEALSGAIRSRTEAPPPAAADGTLGQAADGGPSVFRPPEEAAPVPEATFLTDAYEKIVVTASRVGQDPLDSPSTLTVLTEEDIRLSGISSLPDLLRRVVGVEVMSPSAGQSDIAIRGFNRKANNKVLVLIDGRSTYLDFVAVTFWNALPVVLEDIERIEVIRGPGSAVYGANAATGVVNIITKKPGDEAMTGNILTAEAGSPAYVRGTVYTNGRTRSVNYRIAAGYDQIGRYALNYPADAEAFDFFLDHEDLGSTSFKGDARLDTTFGAKGFASVSGGFSDGVYEFHNIGALDPFGLDMLHHFLRGDLAWGSVHLRSFWNAETATTGPREEYVGQSRTLYSPLDTDIVDLEIEGPVEFDTGSMHHTLNLGAGYRFKRVKFEYLQGGFDKAYLENHFSAFANEQLAVGKLGAVASLRADAHPLLRLQDTISPRLALLYRMFEKTSLRATAGRAFRQPASLESYMDWALPSPTADGAYIRDVGGSDVIVGGNPPLKPEASTTYELGIRDESTFLHTADVVVYLMRISDLIELDPVTRTVAVYDEEFQGIMAGKTGWANVPSAYTSMGAEGELELFPTDGLDLFVNAAFNRITSADDPDEVNLLGNSPFKLNAGVIYRTPVRVDLSLSTHYVGTQKWNIRGFSATTGEIQYTLVELPSRAMLNARIGVKPFEDESLELAVSAWNLGALFQEPAKRAIEHPEGQPLPAKTWGSVIYRF